MSFSLRLSILSACIALYTIALHTAPLSADGVGIVGSDDRVISTEAKFAAVGRLNKSGTGFCTATLIAPDLIVTAAHCVYYSRTKKPIPPNRLHFVANWRRGKHQAHRRGAIVRIAKDFVFDAPGSSDRLRADLALIQLERPIAPNVIKPIRVEREFRKLRLTTPLTQVAYSADRPHLPVIERGCIVREEDDELLLTDCDSNFGSSGAPVLEEKGGQLRLLAVSVAVISDGVLRRAAALRAAQIETVRRTGRNPHNP